MKPSFSKNLIKDDGIFPNNNRLPALIYRNVSDKNAGNSEEAFKDLFKAHGWSNSWTNGIFTVHHYHSTAHEVLGIIRGTVKIQLGGPAGEVFLLSKGDAVMIPAGVAHKNLEQSEDFSCVGAYDRGKDYDLNYGKAEERITTEKNIASLEDPQQDPVLGDLVI